MLQAGHQTVVSYGFLGFSVMSFDGKKNNFDHLEENMFPYILEKKKAIESGDTWVFFRSRSFSWSFKASSLSAIWRRKVA
jgi:hypothetical protein